MSTITPPKGNIPIGSVVINGQAVDVTVNAEWLRYLSQSVFSRIGGTSGSSSEDLTLSQFEDAGIEETKALVYTLRDDLSQTPPVSDSTTDVMSPELSSVLAEIDALRSRVAALEQGTTP